MEYQQQKIELIKLKREQEQAEHRIQHSLAELRQIKDEVRDAAIPDFGPVDAPPRRKSRKRTVSVKRYRINTDGSKTLVASSVPNSTQESRVQARSDINLFNTSTASAAQSFKLNFVEGQDQEESKQRGRSASGY